MTKKNADRDEALARLRAIVKPGDTLYTTVKHVSRSGMSRLISVHAITDNQPQWLDGYIARAGEFTLDTKREALRVGGCGMDMGFHVVYNVSRSLFPSGFGCVGERCPSNDHSNGDRDYTPDPVTVPSAATVGPRHWHRDGGYALRQRWM